MRRALFRTATLWFVQVLLAAGSVFAEEPALSPRATPATLTHLIEHEETLELINLSDRPIVAWMVRTVTRSSQGYEAQTSTGVDAIRDELLPSGTTYGTLLPGASVTIEKPEPWLREDHRGPGASVRHEVGLVVFGNDEAFGDPDLIERLFERRRAAAREAAAALDALDREPARIRDLPMYRDVLDQVADHARARAEIRRRAQEDYELTLDHLRPQDLAILEHERQRDREGIRR